MKIDSARTGFCAGLGFGFVTNPTGAVVAMAILALASGCGSTDSASAPSSEASGSPSVTTSKKADGLETKRPDESNPQTGWRDKTASSASPKAADSNAFTIAITFQNDSSSTVKFYYQNDPATLDYPPGYTCNIASGHLLWSTLKVPAHSSTTIDPKTSSANVCLSAGAPEGSTPDTSGLSYSGPYFIQNTGSSLYIQQTWEPSPISKQWWTGESGTVSGVGSSWNPSNDQHHFSFTRLPDDGSLPKIAVKVTS